MTRKPSRTRSVLTWSGLVLLTIYVILAVATASPLRALWEELAGVVVVWMLYAVRFTFDNPRALEPEVLAFALADRFNPPSPGAIVFTGSSTIGHWSSLQADMAPLLVLNRGLNGAQIHQITFHADRIILPYRPRAVVLYAGENDIAGLLWSVRKTPEQVLIAFREFCEKIHASLPEIPIYFIAIKPARSRMQAGPAFVRANRLVREYCESDRRLHFVDVVPALLGPDGQPAAAIFEKDGIHLNEGGYEILTSVVKPALDKAFPACGS